MSDNRMDERTPLLANNCKNGHAIFDINSTSWKQIFEETESVNVKRPIYKMEQFLIHSKYSERRPKSISETVKTRLEDFHLKNFMHSILPVTDWLPNYTWPHDLTADFIAGCTVAILGVPQSIAYALLGNVPAVVGLYMHFFPLLMYFLLGTSKQNSIGTFAVVCLMTGKIVLKVTHENNEYTPTEVAATVALTAGLFQALMFVFGLGKLMKIFLSEPLVNGFTTASAIHVYATQIPELFGLKLPRRTGTFKLIYVS